MNAETVSYRYTTDELNALLLILDLPGLPGLPMPAISQAAYRAAIDSLSDSGLVTPAGDQAIIDRLTVLLLSSIAKCSFFVRFDAAGRTVLLWRGPTIYIVGMFPEQGECSLTPLPSPDEAEDALNAALIRCAFPLTVASPALLGEETLTASDADQRESIMARLRQSAENHEARNA